MQRISPRKFRRPSTECQTVSPRRARLLGLLGETWRASWRASWRGIAAMLLTGGVMAGSTWATTYDVFDSASFVSAMSSAGTGDTINFTADVTMAAAVGPLNANVTIVGNNHTLDGVGTYQPFFVQSGTVAISDLSITGGMARGGNGGNGQGTGGGALGAGGALFVNAGANVTINNVGFDANSAVGGNAGDKINPYFPGGAGADFAVLGGGGSEVAYGGAGGDGVDGEFGAGGGGPAAPGQNGGNGGFGGGGGGGLADESGGDGGVGGGNGGGSSLIEHGFGGGGAGFGGAVFVREGGNLTITGGSFDNGSTTGGLGVDFSANDPKGSGADGSAAGNGMYLHGSANYVNFAPTTGSSITVNDDIAGTGGVTKSGDGTLILSGTHTYTGDTTVQAGRLAINGSVAGDVKVWDTGALGGNGTIYGDLDNCGVLGAGNSIGFLSVTGNAHFQSGSTIEVEIQPTSAPDGGVTHDYFSAGSATIDSGVNVSVKGASGTYTEGTKYTFFHTNSVLSDRFSSIQDDLAFFDAQLGYDLNSAYFTLIAGSNDYATIAATGNQQSLGQALDRSSQGATGGFATLLDQFRPMTNAQVQNGLSQLGTSVSGSSQQIGVQGTTQMMGMMGNHLRGSLNSGFGMSEFGGGGGGYASASPSSNSPVADSAIALVSYQESTGGLAGSSCDSACDSLGYGQHVRRSPSWLGWTTGYGLGGAAQSDGNADGVHYGLGGVTYGMEKFVDESTRIGFFGGYVGSQVTTNTTHQRRTSNGGNFGTLLTHSSGMHYGTAMAGMQFDDINSQRQMQIGAIAATANGETDGWQGFAYGERGLNLQLTDSMLVRPFAGLQYVYSRQNGYTETGAGAMNLTVHGNDTHSLRSLLGSELAFAARPLRGIQVTPLMRAIYMHEFLDTTTLVNSQFAGVGGSGFSSAGLDLGRDWGIAGFGLSSQLTDHWSLRGDYNTQFNDRQVHHIGSGTLSYVW